MTFDCIVIGVGGMGSAACYHLARRGRRVLGLERFDIPNAMGSSHGSTRILRVAYQEGSSYVPIVRRAHELWRELGAAVGRQILTVTGSIDISEPGAAHPAGRALASCRDNGLTHELLEASDINDRFPGFRIPEGLVGLFQPDGGFVASEAAIIAHTDLALRYGAEIRAREPVTAVTPLPSGGVRVTTARGSYEAAQAIIAAGPWVTSLAGPIGPKLQPVKTGFGWFSAKRPEFYGPDRFPVFTLDTPDGHFYGLPIHEHPGVKIGGPHDARRPGDPEDPDRTLPEAQAARLADCLARYLPHAAGPPLALKGCYYTVSPDDHFIVDRHPEMPQVIVASPCSGHGFKFASVMGEILADLVTADATRHNITPFRLARFGSDDARSPA